MHANGCNVEGLRVRDASDGKFERNFAIGVCENSTICEAYFNLGAGLNNKAQIGNQCFMNKVQCSTRVNQSLNSIGETNK